MFKSKHVGRHFFSDLQGVLPGSKRFCPDFMGFCPDFHQIKTFGGAVASPAPRLLHQCCVGSFFELKAGRSIRPPFVFISQAFKRCGWCW